MSRESQFRSLVVKLLKPLHAFPVENAIDPAGVPDVCTTVGWIELKVADRPVGRHTRVDVTMRPSQRVWHKSWRAHGGRSWTILLLDETWYLHDGRWSSEYLGRVSEDGLKTYAIAIWYPKPTQNSLIRYLMQPMVRTE